MQNGWISGCIQGYTVFLQISFKTRVFLKKALKIIYIPVSPITHHFVTTSRTNLIPLTLMVKQIGKGKELKKTDGYEDPTKVYKTK